MHPDKLNDDGGTPLSFAPRWGHAGVGKITHGRTDVNSDMPDRYGRTPHMFASMLDHKAVMALFHLHQAGSPGAI